MIITPPPASQVRICIYTRAWRSAGAGLFARELARAAANAGSLVTFVAPIGDGEAMTHTDPNLARLRPPREYPGRSRARNAAASVMRMIIGSWMLLRARAGNKAYIFTIPDRLPVTIVQLTLLWLSGARVIFVAHDPLPHKWRLPVVLKPVEKLGHGLTYRLASHIVVLSEPSRLALQIAFPTVTTPITIIEHGLYNAPSVPPLRNTRTLLLFGALRQNKGVIEGMQGAILARANGVDVRLVVAGSAHPDEKGYAADICALAATAPDAIDLRLGYVSDEDLEQLIARCDAFLMPYGAFASQSGVAILAASSARPIIATRVGGIGSLIDGGMPSVILPLHPNADQIATAIAQFYESSSGDWQGRCLSYRAALMQTHSWDVVGRHYVDLARKLAA